MTNPCNMPCHRCIREFKIPNPAAPDLPLSSGRMILCEHCGNKRCPHASDHRMACTGSNEPGQVGEAMTFLEAEAEVDQHEVETDHEVMQMEDDDGNHVGWACKDCDWTIEFQAEARKP